MEVFLLQQLPQKPVLALLCFSLLAKGRNTDGEYMQRTQMKQLSSGLADAPEEVPEDIRLMRDL